MLYHFSYQQSAMRFMFTLVSGHLSQPVVNGGANVLRDHGAHGGSAASAAQPARRRREQAKQKEKKEEFMAGKFGNSVQYHHVQSVPSELRLGFVDLDFKCSTVCPTLIGLMGMGDEE